MSVEIDRGHRRIECDHCHYAVKVRLDAPEGVLGDWTRVGAADLCLRCSQRKSSN